MGAIRKPVVEALRTLRAVPGVIAPVRLSLILLACGGTCYTVLEHIGDPSCDDNTDRWEVYLRRKIDLFPKTSVYHTLFIWGKKTDARVTVLNT